MRSQREIISHEPTQTHTNLLGERAGAIADFGMWNAEFF